MRPFLYIAQLGLLVAGAALCGLWVYQTGRIVSVSASEPVHARQVSANAAVAKIEIPKANVATVVLEGVDDAVLGRASGHFPGSALPGGLGNFAVAGHRDTVFRNLQYVRAGMDILVTCDTGKYRYRVRSVEVVSPDQVEVLEMARVPSLTLITCYPFHYIGAAPMRFCVHAELMTYL